MDHIKDAINVNMLALKRTIGSANYFPIVVVILIFTMVVDMLATLLFGMLAQVISFPFLWGVLRYLVDVATLSLLMVALSKVLSKRSLDMRNFTDDWQRFMSPLMNTRFIFWLIEIVLSMLSGALGQIPYLLLILGIAYNILVSPMLESIYIAGEQGQDALMFIIEFLKNNILQWLPVLVLFPLIMSRIELFSWSNILAGKDFSSLPRILILYLLLAFVYIYKGHLFSILHNSSMRKRKFMGVMDNDDY